MNATSMSAPPGNSPKLLDQVRQRARDCGHSQQAANSFAYWSGYFILFHNKRHPKDLGMAEINRYMEHVAKTHKDPLIAVRGCRTALEFLYNHVLCKDIGELPWPRTKRLGRHHVYDSSLQRAVRQAGEKAGLTRRIHCHTFRHSFATHLVERGRISARCSSF